MPTISSYALQLVNVNFSAISASTFDLFITEGAPEDPDIGLREISDPEMLQLRAQGRTVVGYVNVAVTDDARYYWNPSWTSNGQDTGTPIAGQAPSWLDQAVPIDFDGVAGQDALIVEYWDPAWQQIVIAQAVDLVERGYSGVFLDDVGRYFQAGEGSGTIPLMANRMLDFIHAIRLAITEVNPDAIIVTNTNPYIVTDSPDGPSSTRAATYRADVDIHLIENQGTAALDHFATYFGGEPLLILQSVTPPPLTYEQAWARGILYTAPDNDYDALGTFAYPATASPDTLSGGDGPNQIGGLGGNDVLIGGGGNDTLSGGEGADLLDGGAGADQLAGGLGDDVMLVDHAGDIIVESLNQGRDVVYATVNYALSAGAHAEVLSAAALGGTDPLNLTGNELANEIYGNAGANVLRGGGGTDLLLGGHGDDDYYIASGAETVLEYSGQGRDIVYTNVSHTLAAGSHVEILSALSLSGTNALNFGGNELDNVIYGNAGANLFYGGGGNDTLVGGFGDDTYYILGGNEALYEGTGGGRDTAYAFVSYTLTGGAEVEILSTASIGGTGAINLTGNAFGQEIDGNNGANTLDGKGGSDLLVGYGGVDMFAFTSSLGTGNIDYIHDLVSGTDKIALDDAVFAGLTPGALSAGAFVTGSAAGDANDRIIYDSATGQLLFDADGNGAGAAVQFASVAAGTLVVASDFVVI